MYGGQKLLHVPQSSVWRPDVTVYNSVSQVDVIEVERRLITIGPEGEILLSNPSVYTTRCKLNVDKFPFDSQICKLKLSSWVYGIDDLVMNLPTSFFSEPEYIGNSEWDVVSVTWNKDVQEDIDIHETEKFQEVEYYIKLKRRSAYYIYVLLIPTFIVSTLCLVGLFTPYNNYGLRVERVTLGLTTLLSLAVMLNIVGNDMPKAARLPHLGSYVLAEIILCSIGVLLSIALLLAHQRLTTRKILPISHLSQQNLGMKASKVDRLGLSVLESARGFESADTMGHLNYTLHEVINYISRVEEKERLRLYWVKKFDCLDIFFLILFQVVNLILTLCYTFIY